MDSKQFGLELRKIRKEKRMTMIDLAKITGITQAYISMIETGKKKIPQPETLKKLADGLGVSHMYLMDLAGHTSSDIEPAAQGMIDSGLKAGIKDITLTVPNYYKSHDEKGFPQYEIARNDDELKSWLFDLETLLKLNIDLYYRGRKLNKTQLHKVQTMLMILIERDYDYLE